MGAVKFIAVIVIALLLAAVAFLWFQPAGWRPLPERAENAAAFPVGAQPSQGDAASSAELEALRTQVAMLGDQVGSLSAELELLRTSVQRRPVEPAGSAATEALLSAAAGQDRFTDAQREAITEILERAREQEATLRAEERAAREEQMVLDRAGRIAEKLGLAPADQTLLADHLRTESDKRREIIDRSRQADYDRELLRDEFVALRDWSEAHLIETFGPDRGIQHLAIDSITVCFYYSRTIFICPGLLS